MDGPGRLAYEQRRRALELELAGYGLEESESHAPVFFRGEDGVIYHRLSTLRRDLESRRDGFRNQPALYALLYAVIFTPYIAGSLRDLIELAWWNSWLLSILAYPIGFAAALSAAMLVETVRCRKQRAAVLRTMLETGLPALVIDRQYLSCERVAGVRPKLIDLASWGRNSRVHLRQVAERYPALRAFASKNEVPRRIPLKDSFLTLLLILAIVIAAGVVFSFMGLFAAAGLVIVYVVASSNRSAIICGICDYFLGDTERGVLDELCRADGRVKEDVAPGTDGDAG